ncbi:MAG TPA: Uma2 family endonuclease [Longimicrobium sp.]|jgi:Uma2 family endonuclease
MQTAPEPTRKLFTVDEFEKMADAGIFPPESRLELIDGEIIEMTPVGGRHVTCVFAVEDYLRAVARPELRVATQNVLRLADGSPWPDITLLRRDRLVPGELPRGDACVLVVEVADSTVLHDRNKKRLAYARAGIPEYWVIDLQQNTLVAHRQPRAGDYDAIAEHARGTSFVSPALDGREVPVDPFLPSAG